MTSPMYHEFEACRVSGDGNAVFPDKIIIDDEEEVVIHRKPKLIGCKETKIRFGAIASIEVNKHLLLPTSSSKHAEDAR